MWQIDFSRTKKGCPSKETAFIGFKLKDLRSSLTVGTKNVNDLVSNHVLNCLTSGLKVLTGIEVIRMLSEVLTDVTCHSKTDIGVDVDLANSECSCLTELLLRDTNCVRHVSAVLVNHLNKLLRYGRRTVENDRETRKSLDALFENVETERRRYKDALFISCALSCCELVSTVRSTDSDCERVASCSGNEFLNLFRSCVALVASLNNYFVLDTS